MIEKLLKVIGALPYDKALHFIVGAVAFAMTFPVFGWYALAIVACIAVIKEFYDRFTPNHVSDFRDAIATFAGALVVAIPLVFTGCTEQVDQWGDAQIEGQHEKAMEFLGNKSGGEYIYKRTPEVGGCVDAKMKERGYYLLQDEIDCIQELR